MHARATSVVVKNGVFNFAERLTKNPGTIIQNHYGNMDNGSEKPPRFILGYWCTRCLGAPLRMILSAAQVNHWVLLYDAKEDNRGGWDKSCWFQDKEWLQKNFPFINLPFLVDCSTGQIISQTNAIAMYLGRELNLLGKTKQETAQCEELLNELTDLRNLMLDFAYKTDQKTIETEAKDVLEKSHVHFNKIEQHFKQEYSSSKIQMSKVCHLVGNRYSVPDFFLWECLDQFEGLCTRFKIQSPLGGDPDNAYPHLSSFYQIFSEDPVNQPYLSQYDLAGHGLVGKNSVPNGIQLPYNSPYARFGSCPNPTDVYIRGQKTPWRARGIIKQRYPRIKTEIDGKTLIANERI